MRGLYVASVLVTASVLVGCASMFNADIYNAKHTAGLALPSCNMDPKQKEQPIPTPTPIKPVRPATVSELHLGELDLSVVSEGDSDLAAGLKVLSNATSRNGVKALFGVDPAELSSHLPLINEDSLNYASRALELLKYEKLSDGLDFNGNTFIKETHEELVTAVSKATASYGWTANFAQKLGVFAKRAKPFKATLVTTRGEILAPESTVSPAGVLVADALVDAKATSPFVAYFVAYFRDGKILDVQFDGNELKQKIDDAVKNYATQSGKKIETDLLSKIDDQIGTFYGDLTNKLCKSTPINGKCTVLGGIGDKTFVTRAGKSLAFSGITITLDPEGKKAVSTTKPNYLAVGEDLLRVLIEASWDSVNPVPGTDNSTLCAELGYCAKTPAEKSGVTHANSAGDTTEAATAQVVGIVIRGGWLLSLNNEAAAESLTTGISVAARKIAERVAYAQDTAPCKGPGNRGVTVGAHGGTPQQ